MHLMDDTILQVICMAENDVVMSKISVAVHHEIGNKLFIDHQRALAITWRGPERAKTPVPKHALCRGHRMTDFIGITAHLLNSPQIGITHRTPLPFRGRRVY